MVKVAGRGPRKGGTPPGRQGTPNRQQQQGGGNTILKTNKGVFSFTMVADGCYIEHKWGQNSGHVGVPLEAIPGFITRLQGLYSKTTGQKLKSPGSGPKATIGKGAKTKKEQKAKEKKEKKEPPAKKSMEDLDAELMSYTAQRGVEDAPVGEAAAEAPPAE